MKTGTTKQKSMSCAAMQRVIEEAVQRAREESGRAGVPALRAAIVAGLEARRDVLAKAVHYAALAKSSVDHWAVTTREADEVILELAGAAAGLEEVLAAVMGELAKAERSRRAS